jgi:glycosyltransferase involved in cell wall biosynthesis
MRIGFVTPEYVTEDYFSGGLANYVQRAAMALSSLGHEVHVITLSNLDQAEFDQQGLRIHRVANPRGRWLRRLTRRRLSDTLFWLGFSFRAYRKLRQLHKQAPFDILQFPNSRACGLVTSLLLHVPYAVRLSVYRPAWREYAGLRDDWDARALEWLEWLQMRLSRHVYAPSAALKHMLAREAKLTHVQVIRPPFYLETLDWDRSVYEERLQDKPYLLFFGRFQLHKGFHILAQALPRVLQSYPDCHAVFVGLDMATSLAPCMKDYARGLCGQDADRLIFIGQLPHAQLYPIVAGARLVVLPSLVDNLPNTCLEAMALGKPVIGTVGASFEELISDGETGFLVPPGDVTALEEKIKAAWAHPRLGEIGQAAQGKVNELAPERTTQELLAYYEHIVGGSTP